MIWVLRRDAAATFTPTGMHPGPTGFNGTGRRIRVTRDGAQTGSDMTNADGSAIHPARTAINASFRGFNAAKSGINATPSGV